MTDNGFRQLSKRLAERIRALRFARGMTQEQLAAAAAVSTSFIAHLEKGTRSPTLQLLYRIAVALGAEAGFYDLFPLPAFHSIDDVLADAAPKRQRVRHKKAP